MKVKVKRHKKSPVPFVTEQVKETSTIIQLRKTMSCYSLPKKVFFDNYNPTTSKSS